MKHMVRSTVLLLRSNESAVGIAMGYNKMIKLLSIIGARPHYMKVTPIHHEAARRGLAHKILHTGQHYDPELTSVYERELNLPSAVYNLHVGSDRQNIQLGHMIIGLDQFFEKHRPDMVLVYGDTNSTAAAAISAAKAYIPVAHIEAGLREFRKDVPEEINKLLIDAVSDLFFCSTKTAVEQLYREGKKEGVFFTGDIVFDLVRNGMDRITKVDTVLTNKLKDKPYYFVTVHREVNTSNQNRLKEIVEAICHLDQQVVFSVHPRTKKALEAFDLWNSLQQDKIYTVNSRPFWETQWLIAHAKLTLTDSGGVSKESYFHQTPSILLDDQIEWTELVESGWIKLAGASSKKILEFVKSIKTPTVQPDVFGGGHAAEIIINEIVKYYATRK